MSVMLWSMWEFTSHHNPGLLRTVYVSMAPLAYSTHSTMLIHTHTDAMDA